VIFAANHEIGLEYSVTYIVCCGYGTFLGQAEELRKKKIRDRRIAIKQAMVWCPFLLNTSWVAEEELIEAQWIV
jgi:hypothetical protein